MVKYTKNNTTTETQNVTTRSDGLRRSRVRVSRGQKQEPLSGGRSRGGKRIYEGEEGEQIDLAPSATNESGDEGQGTGQP